MDQEGRFHNFELSDFKKAQNQMIATSENSYRKNYDYNRYRKKQYTKDEVTNIIEGTSLEDKRTLSQYFFETSGFYKQLILHYATLLKYAGILIPAPSPGKTLDTPHIYKKYNTALDFLDAMRIETILPVWAQKILLNGAFYAIIVKNDKNSFAIQQLPIDYCRTRFEDLYGNDIIEFDLSYFDTILDKKKRELALSIYPKVIVQSYNRWTRNKNSTSRWVMIPSDVGICFTFFNGEPFFIEVIPALMDYDEAVETEQERAKNEIRKIIVQKIPHTSEGRLLFEPEEAVEIHNGAVGMVRNNKNTSVLTTYADVDSITSSSSNESRNTTLEVMKQNFYSQAGISKEIFAASGGNTTDTSLKYDTAIMMLLANKFAKFITNTINFKFSNTSIRFKFTILPVTYHNEKEYLDGSYKLATAGYSLLVPAIAQGFTQKDIVNIKDLENDVLKLTDRLLPPKTSYTQTEEQDNNGRPSKETEDKKDKTLKNEESLNNNN